MPRSALLLLAVLGLARPLVRASESGLAAPLKHVSAAGISFDYPSELTLSTKSDFTGTRISMKDEDRLPWILVQAFSVPIEPKSAHAIFLTEHKDQYNAKHWPYTESATQEMIAGELRQGTELDFQNGSVSFRQRFFTLRREGRTIIVMVMAQADDDSRARRLLAPVATSLTVASDPQMVMVGKVGGIVLAVFLVLAIAVVVVLVRKSGRRAAPPPLPSFPPRL